MYFVIRKNDIGEYEYATCDAFNLNGARAFADTIDASRSPLVIKDEVRPKVGVDDKATCHTGWFAVVRGFIAYVLLGMTKPHTKRGFYQLKAT